MANGKPLPKEGKRKKLPKPNTVQKKCDVLLTPIVKKLFPFSMFGGATEVAHHFIHKSKSNRLRYDFDNLIPLTHKQHQALHHNESFWSGQIIDIKGIEWFRVLEKRKQESIKTDVHYYIAKLKELTEILNELQ